MYEAMELAEKEAETIAEIYYNASTYITDRADEIFEKFKDKHNLTEEQAKKLIEKVHDKNSLDEVRNAIGTSDIKDAELLAKLESAAYRARIQRLMQLHKELDQVMQNTYQQERQQSDSFYSSLARDTYYKSIFDMQQMAGVGFDFNHISAKQIDKVLSMNWSGEHYSKRIWKNTQKLADTLKEELLINLLTGRTNRETAQLINYRFAVGASYARRLVRTESNFVSGELNFKAYEDAGIEEYRFLATLDLRTSPICRSLDGKFFKVSERQPGVNCNPMHPWCRSTTIAVIDRDLLENMKRSALDPATGKRVMIPATMTYNEWYKKFVEGSPEAKLEEKKIKNQSSDRKQYENYRQVLGDDIPKTLDDFQNIKYTDSEKWKIVNTRYKDILQQEKIRTEHVDKNIHIGKQGKHIVGNNNYIKGRSYLTVSIEKAQELVNKYAGTGRIIRDSSGKYLNKEKITTDEQIGVCVDLDGHESATKSFIIHYSQKGVHIVPTGDMK
jgi:SPP1 gp7 family putative phage head morphogenesis protein